MLPRVLYALSLTGAVALSEACGATVAPTAPLQAPAQTAASSPSDDLLYVGHVDGEASHKPRGVVSILTFPQGKPVATISGFGPWGMCSDPSGNVWIVAYTPEAWYLYQFAHGGTKPIAKIRMPKGSFGVGCAVDPTTGNLAVMNDSNGVSYSGSIDVWAGAQPGKPAVYNVPFVPQYAAYDDQGNLFFDGFPGGSDFSLVLGEVARGSDSVTRIRLDKRIAFPGGVQWDGAYIAVETGGFESKGRPRIYRVQVSGSSGTVVGAVYPSDPALYYAAVFCIDGRTMVSMAGSKGGRIELWPYPAGGKSTKFIGRFKGVRGMAISAGSGR
jgi:hypothetical protein